MLEVDRSGFPLIRATFRGAINREDVDRLLDPLNELMDEGRKFALILRAEDAPVPEMGVLKHLAQWLRTRRDDMRRYGACIGLHLDSAALRGALKFINTMVTPPNPQAAFATIEETEAWVEARMREAGLAFPTAGAPLP